MHIFYRYKQIRRNYFAKLTSYMHSSKRLNTTPTDSKLKRRTSKWILNDIEARTKSFRLDIILYDFYDLGISLKRKLISILKSFKKLYNYLPIKIGASWSLSHFPFLFRFRYFIICTFPSLSLDFFKAPPIRNEDIIKFVLSP